MEKISIIMPNYNGDKTIENSILSVQTQTYENWELIVIDDCSTDNSNEIIERYAEGDARIIVLKTNENTGSATHPRNMGIEMAAGRYIAFLDSDDIWFSNKLSQQVSCFQEEKIAIVFSDYEKMDIDGKLTNRLINAPKNINYRKLLKSNVIGCLTAIYDTKKVGKVYFKEVGHEDFVMWLEILKKGYIAHNVGGVLAAYRVGCKSLSSNKLKVLRWQWNIYRRIESLNIIQSVYYFTFYAFNGLLKFQK